MLAPVQLSKRAPSPEWALLAAILGIVQAMAGLAHNLRQVVARSAFPGAATYYRSFGAKRVPALLKLLGVADPAYRADFYTLCKLVGECARDGGTIAECGVYRGSTLLGMAHALKSNGASNWHLLGFDSFEGFPEPAPEDALSNGTFHPKARKGVFADTSYEGLQAKARALGYARDITLVKGYFENTLAQYADREFVAAHIDCDLYEGYKTCLEFFYPRLRPGGVLVFDEYDYSNGVYPGAQRAIDEFFRNKPEDVERLPEARVPRYFIRKK